MGFTIFYELAPYGPEIWKGNCLKVQVYVVLYQAHKYIIKTFPYIFMSTKYNS